MRYDQSDAGGEKSETSIDQNDRTWSGALHLNPRHMRKSKSDGRADPKEMVG